MAVSPAFHVAVQLEPENQERFLEWKRREGEIQLRTPGFIRRLVLEDLTRPNIYYYMSFWESDEALAALHKEAAFRSVAAEFNIPLFEADVREGRAPAPPMPGGALAKSMERVRCEVLVNEKGNREWPAEGTEPYGFHYYVDTGVDGAAAYETFKRRESKGQLDAPGFIKRLLLRTVEHPGGFFYFSLWTSRAAAAAFHDAFVASEDYKRFYGQLHPYVVAPTFSDCRLISDQER